MRGIVVCPPTYAKIDGSFIISPEIDEQLLRSWLLFWDMLDFPRLRTGLVVTSDLLEFLIQRNVAKATTLWPNTNIRDVELLVWPLIEALRINRENSRHHWSIALGEGALLAPDFIRSDSYGLEIQLLQAIPVPDKTVPLDDILQFRFKRRDQLESLWASIDDISSEYQDDPRRPLAEQAAVRRFANEALTTLQVTREAGFPFRMASLAARFSATAALTAAAGVYFGGAMPEIVGNSLVAAASLLITDVPSMVERAKGGGAYAYVLSFHKEVFGPE